MVGGALSAVNGLFSYGGSLSTIASIVLDGSGAQPNQDLADDGFSGYFVIIDEFHVEERWWGCGAEPPFLAEALDRTITWDDLFVATAPQPLYWPTNQPPHLMTRGREKRFRRAGFVPYQDGV
jgi:hypothetical protein